MGPSRARGRIAITVVGAVAATAVLGAVIAGRWHDFVTALQSAPIWIFVLAAALQSLALVARSEAWHVCVRAAGGSVKRRPLYRAASVGYLGSQLNSQVGTAARIAALRKTAPELCPRIPALIAAEVPIVAVEIAFAALTSFTLVGPLGLPWWTPVMLFVLTVLATGALRRLAVRRQLGFWSGLAVLRTLEGRTRIVLLVLVAVLAQIARNWLMLDAIGIHASVFDAIAVLIAMAALSQLPVGPSVGAAAVVLILGTGTDGAAVTAAGGVLLTATGCAGALAYVAWAGLDRAWSRPVRVPAPDPAVAVLLADSE